MSAALQNSMNPEIDVGQVEGAFVMGLGYFLTEKMEFDLETGEPTTVSTWVWQLLLHIYRVLDILG